MKRALLALALGGTVAAAVLAPVLLLADAASCSVTASSYADAVLNSPRGEDTEFFVSQGGVPNLMFVLDTSGSMQRLPPDGASAGWGTFEKPGNAAAGQGYGCTNTWANARVYASPCGTTTLEGSPFNPAPGQPPPNFAEAKDSSGKYCPYMVSGNQPPATDKPGFDPDFYPTFFDGTRVYHDTVLSPVSTYDGWDDKASYPTTETSIGAFCNRWSTNAAKKASCDACMRDQGYFFDGTYVAWIGPSCGSTDECRSHGYGTCIQNTTGLEYSGADNGTARCRIPNVWFSGNFLNFTPPKFVMARKVLKDVLTSVRRIRLGLTRFSSSGDGGTLVEPLNPGCNMLNSPSSFDSNRSAIRNAINNTTKISFSGGTPLAETLLDVGHLYLSRSLNWFNSSYQDSGFEDAVATSNNKSVCFKCQASAILLISDGAPSDDGTVPGTTFAASPATKAVSDQANAYGGMAGYNITGITSANCPSCNNLAEAPDTSPEVSGGNCLGQQSSGACSDSRTPIQSYLPKVAWYLNHFDLRDNNEVGADGLKMIDKQTITTYTIGLGTRGNASLILQDTADAGGGLYNGGTGADITDAKTLRDAILRVLEDVNTRSTSFGSSSYSSFQVAATQGILVPRFEPARTATWKGHLYAFKMFSEFTSGKCSIPATGGSGPANGDLDCDGKCGSDFLQDANGAFVQEDSTGKFVENDPPNLPACGPANKCGTCGKAVDASGVAKPAVPFWDAGSKLSPITTDASGNEVANGDFDSSRTWDRRAIYTVIDGGDGRFTSADRLLDLRTADPAALAPYLNIIGNRTCSSLAMRLTSRGNPEGGKIVTELASGTYRACAKAILDFVRGADIFNERAGLADASLRCSTWPATYCTRKFQLGDIFHSSPVEVSAPRRANGLICLSGRDGQCLPSLFSPSIPNPPAKVGSATAYDDYQTDSNYQHRNKFVVVGANDGMAHAFLTGRWKAADDPSTPKVDESRPPYDGYYDAGTGAELWAFIPPDLLPKLRLLLDATHHLFVDGTPMVRDVWIDGTPGNKVGGATADGARQGGEFHTVAIFGERRGGTHYFALDVTDAGDDLDGVPRFLWLYPQPNDPEELSFGETYDEFLPKPPPIGPVRIDAGPAPCTGNRKEYAASTGSRCFEERWIVFLSGGFDPQYTKGRGVHMVDVATGREIFDFSAPPGPASACDSTRDPRCHLQYPVAATVGMMMWGKDAHFLSAAAVDGYFDTATFGDTGGQLWVLRFNDPALLDASGKATNWFGARVFQQGKTETSCDFCGTQPMFYITSNVPLAANGLYRTFVGTGDRYNLLDISGGRCGPDNLRACLIKGCTVKLADASGNPGAVYGVDPLLGTQSYGMNLAATCSGALGASSYFSAASPPSGGACTTVTSEIDGLTISCPSTNTCSGSAESTTKTAAVACAGGSCDEGIAQMGIPIDLKGNPDKRNWFFGLQVFEDKGDRAIFTTLDQAKRYDAARLSEANPAVINVNRADQKVAGARYANAADLGWSYYFDHGDPNPTGSTVIVDGSNRHIYRTDERTAAVSDIWGGCTLWNTMQPAVPVGAYDATTSCPVDSPCKGGTPANLSYMYGAKAATGELCVGDDTGQVRSLRTEAIAPPQGPRVVHEIGPSQARDTATGEKPGGGGNMSSTQLGATRDLVAPTEWVPVDRKLHACRHAPKDQPPSDAACR